MDRFIGPFLVALGLAHLLLGVTIFSGPLKDIWEDGVFDGVSPDGVSLSAHYDRMAAVWFVLFAPILFSLGQIVNRAIQRGDFGDSQDHRDDLSWHRRGRRGVAAHIWLLDFDRPVRSAAAGGFAGGVASQCASNLRCTHAT